MSVSVYNSLTRCKEQVVPWSGSRTVLAYICGPTVYNAAHAGHARTYVHADVIQRLLQHFGYHVTLVMNITDIDDKLLQRAHELQQPVQQVAQMYESAFRADMQMLGVLPPQHTVRVTEHIPEIIAYIERIMHRGLAYAASDGSVYFDLRRYASLHPHNAKLHTGAADCSLQGGRAQAAAAVPGKRAQSDFALWKAAAGDSVAWDSPWGRGRPGWHIECSAMASTVMELYGDGSVDMHLGGADLLFPHHQNEMAQACAYYSRPHWVKHFVHTGHLNVQGCKMSKSLKNFVTVEQMLRQHTARQVRLFFLLHKYSAPMEYSAAAVHEAVRLEERLFHFFSAVHQACSTAAPVHGKVQPADADLIKQLSAVKCAVDQRLQDDFDTPGALLLLCDLVRNVHRYIDDAAAAVQVSTVAAAGDYVATIFAVFGVCFRATATAGSSVNAAIEALAVFRDAVRAAAKCNDAAAVLAVCDEVRDRVLPALGFQLEDGGKHGYTLKQKL